MGRPLIVKNGSLLPSLCCTIVMLLFTTACVNGQLEKNKIDNCSSDFFERMDTKNTDFVSKGYSDYKNLEEIEIYKSATKDVQLIIINRVGETSKSISKALICGNNIKTVLHQLHVNSGPYSQIITKEIKNNPQDESVYSIEYTFENNDLVSQRFTEESNPEVFDEDLSEILYSRFLELQKQNADFLKSE